MISQIAEKLPHYAEASFAMMQKLTYAKNYIKTTIRALIKQKGFTAINIIGLTLGLTCSIMIFLWIGDELKFDKTHKDGVRIYRMFINVRYQDGSINTWSNAPQPLESVLEEEYPEVKHAMMISWNGDRLLAFKEENIKRPGVIASKEFFEVLKFHLLEVIFQNQSLIFTN